MATAYVIGGYISNGGTRMALAIGEVAHDRLGMDVRVVQASGETPSSRYDYKNAFPQISLDEMKAAIQPTDLLVCNPSFSYLGLGDTINARKVMYVQGFTTFADIDRGFDCYVAVSSYVGNFLRDAHDLEMPVVPAFIQPSSAVADESSGQRDGVLIYVKHNLVARAVEPLVNSLTGVKHVVWREGHHNELRRAMRACLAFCYVSRPEGFGLAPLEAMSEGAIVIATDTRGGRDYLRHGENAFVVPVGHSAAAHPYVMQVLAEPGGAAAMRAAGKATAARYGREAFDRRWDSILRRVMDGRWNQANASTWLVPD